MLMCAFLMKSAVFPFHFWQPDFHTAAPTPVHAVLSSVVVKVGVYGLIRLTMLLFTVEAPLVRTLLIILGVIGIYFGSLAALRTYDAKRMLAYSTFGQIGFILVGIGWGTPLALIGAIVYTVNHAFIKSALLMITGAISSRMPDKSARLTDIIGAGKTMSLIGALYLLGGLALAGVPPMNGFISKLALVRGGIQAESWLIIGLAVAAGIITLMYMMRTWQHVFQAAPREDLHLKPYGDSVLAPALLISLCVLLGLYAVPLVQLATEAVNRLGDPQLYIRGVLGG
jgi:multicomponent Na+:H+ antiporter subunit D